MPRRVRIRQTGEPDGEGAGEERRQWVAHWKQWAVGQLPATAPRAIKVELRVQVERALGRLAPGDDEEEIREVVLGMVDTATARIRAEAERVAREDNRRASVALAGPLLNLALRKFPRDAVAMMLKQPGYSGPALTQRLKRHLERHVTGDETPEEILARVEVWAERRLAEQPPSARRWGGTVAAVAGAGVAALSNPAIRKAARTGLARAHEKGLDLWKQWISRAQPPGQP